MTLSRIRDHSKQAVVARMNKCTALVPHILKKRQLDSSSVLSSNFLLLTVLTYLDAQNKNFSKLMRRSLDIHLTSFTDHHFVNFSEEVCLSLFRFEREEIYEIARFITWPETRTHTYRNRYGTSPILVTCVTLRRLASPNRWKYLEEKFGLHGSHLSEIFWEGVQHFQSESVELILETVHTDYWKGRFESYDSAVMDKSRALDNVVSFIDGTNLAIARPSSPDIDQRVTYNGHKRKHTLKFQAMATPCGLAIHVAGPIEGRRHDWTLNVRSGLDGTLQEAFEFEGKQYVTYGDSRYSARSFLYVPFSGSNLSTERSALTRLWQKGVSLWNGISGRSRGIGRTWMRDNLCA